MDLLDGWDPLNGNKMHHYQQSLNWDSASQK
jgi:hypothetical protein